MAYLVEVSGKVKCIGTSGHKDVDIWVDNDDIIAVGFAGVVGRWPLDSITYPTPQSILFVDVDKGHYLANVPEIFGAIQR